MDLILLMNDLGLVVVDMGTVVKALLDMEVVMKDLMNLYTYDATGP